MAFGQTTILFGSILDRLELHILASLGPGTRLDKPAFAERSTCLFNLRHPHLNQKSQVQENIICYRTKYVKQMSSSNKNVYGLQSVIHTAIINTLQQESS